MRVEIIQGGRVLRTIHHNGRNYVEAPPAGDYQIRLTNTSVKCRMAVVSVDGINVIDGTDAGFDGPGYVLSPFQSITIKGWHRSHSEVARFTFAEAQSSYGAGTGRGVKNAGAIGVAVFDEKEKPQPVFIPPPVIIREHHHHYPRPWWPVPYQIWYSGTAGHTTLSTPTFSMHDAVHDGSDPAVVNCCASMDAVLSDEGPAKTRGVAQEVSESVDLGTAYGVRDTMHTQDTEFERATSHPTLVIEMFYATTEKLRQAGVPVDRMVGGGLEGAQAFPAAPGACAPPPGWRG